MVDFGKLASTVYCLQSNDVDPGEGVESGEDWSPKIWIGVDTSISAAKFLLFMCICAHVIIIIIISAAVRQIKPAQLAFGRTLI